jgi:hypothetical protein
LCKARRAIQRPSVPQEYKSLQIKNLTENKPSNRLFMKRSVV